MQAEAMGPAGVGLGAIGLTQPGVSGARGSDASAQLLSSALCRAARDRTWANSHKADLCVRCGELHVLAVRAPSCSSPPVRETVDLDHAFSSVICCCYLFKKFFCWLCCIACGIFIP